MPHGGWAGTMMGDVLGQPRHIKRRQIYHVKRYYGKFHVTGEDGWFVACSIAQKTAQKEVNRLNRGGGVFYCTVFGHDLDCSGRPAQLKKFLAKSGKRSR